ncbi:MAG: hypothetical protein IJS87_02480 [Rhodocyclaceae bacterium]|nr:hypothetical protein [Rhodocyclaceae bacterium]
MTQLFANNAFGTLAAPVSSTDTTITLNAGEGARFPVPGNAQDFLITVCARTTAGIETQWEIMRVTAVSGDTFSVARAQEGTAAVDWPADTPVEMRVTAGTLGNFAQGDVQKVQIDSWGNNDANNIFTAKWQGKLVVLTYNGAPKIAVPARTETVIGNVSSVTGIPKAYDSACGVATIINGSGSYAGYVYVNSSMVFFWSPVALTKGSTTQKIVFNIIYFAE